MKPRSARSDELVHAIQSHNFAAEGCPKPELFMEKVLYAIDELMERTIAAMRSFAPDRDTFASE